MPDYEDAFRQGLGRIDTLRSPLPPLDAGALAARAAQRHGRRLGRPAPVRLLTAAAAVLLVAGTTVGSWLAWGPGRDPVPAVPPTPAPSATQLVISPLTRTPSAHEVLVDDPLLIDHEIAGEGGVPSGFWVDGDTITVDDQRLGRLATYHAGEVVDAVETPPGGFSQFAVWDGTYYTVGETLRAYTREGDRLVETTAPAEISGVNWPADLVIEGSNLVAQSLSGDRYLLAGPGPLASPPTLEMVDDGFTVRDGEVNAHIQVGWEPSGIYLLGRDAEHVWYVAHDSRQRERVGSQGDGFVYEFATDGRLTATYTLGPDVLSDGVKVSNGRVYTLVVEDDSPWQADDTVQVWELKPNPADATPTADPADECDLILVGVDPIACTAPGATEPPIESLPGDAGTYILSVADGGILCDVGGAGSYASCAVTYGLEQTDSDDSCEVGEWDPDFASLAKRDDQWLAQVTGCRADRLLAEQQPPPVLPADKLLTVGDIAVLATADGITVWNGRADHGFAIIGERAVNW